MWAITPEERGKHDKQFDSLAPVLGYVSGGSVVITNKQNASKCRQSLELYTFL